MILCGPRPWLIQWLRRLKIIKEQGVPIREPLILGTSTNPSTTSKCFLQYSASLGSKSERR
jgi:hypothetical protein